MPIPNIKSIRGFTRRKSGGNDLDGGKPTDAPLPAVPAASGFRVIPREEASRRSTGPGALLDGRPVKDFSVKRQISGDDWASNRGSNSTASSGAPNIFDSLGENGFSSSSTLQSPVEAVKKDSPQSKFTPFLNLSDDLEDDFGNIFAGLADPRRSRLLEDDVLTKPPIPVFARSDSEPVLSHMSRPSPVHRAAATPPPPPPHMSFTDRYASPYSHKSQNSRDLLMSSPNLGSYSPTRGDDSPLPTPPPKDEGHMLLPREKVNLAVPQLPYLQRTTSNESFTRSGATEDADALLVRDSWKAARTPFGSELPKSKSHLLAPQHSKLASSLSSSQNSLATPSISSGNSSVHAPEAYQPTRTQQTTPGPPDIMPAISSNGSTPKPYQAESEEVEHEEDMPLFDAGVISAIQAIGHNGTIEKQQKRPALNEGKRVMSTKEFEALQKKNVYRATFIQTAEPKSDSEDDYEDDEDDEATQLAKRRAEQHKKAQHMIWRQKMVKDIGDHSSPLPPRPSYGRMSQSSPNVALHTSKLSLSFSETANGAEPRGESDDDEVPLGVLQAHGFPQQGIPPDAGLNSQSYTGFQRPLSSAGPYARPGSPSGSVSGAVRGGALPPFARKLPQDPYLGQASLNQGMSREALPYRAGSMPHFAPMGAPPNGLVGVIADEETKRGMRRANPNAAMRQSVMLPQNMPMMQPGMPMMTPQGMMMAPNQMPMMMPPQQMGMGIDVQQQFLQQMQAMQQQNAVLVDMIQNMNNGGAPSMMNGMGGMSQPGYAQSRAGPSRPVSMAQSGRAMSMLNLQLPDFSNHSRTMTMSGGASQQWQASKSSRAPSVYGFGGPGTNYAPSVAPSERSNIGQPSRYKPVQNSTLDDNMSVVGGSSSSFLPPIDVGGSSSRDGKKKSGFLSAIVHPPYRGKGKENAFKGIEEEDEDWSSFAQDRKAGTKV